MAGGVVLVAAAAAVWWMFGGAPASVPVVESEAPDEPATLSTTGVELAAGRRPGAVATDAAPAGYVATIRGRVTGPQGAPVPDVLVLLRVEGGFDDRGAVDPAQRGKAETERMQRWFAAIDAPTVDDDVGALRVTTGADGRFTVAVDRWGNWNAEARPAPPLCGGRGYVWLAREANEGKITIALATGDALRGRVVDAGDQPLAAVVSGSWTGGAGTGVMAPAATDPATGAFVLGAIPAGKATLMVRVAGRGEVTVRTPVPAPEPFVIRVPAGGTVVGRVTDPAGTALADVDVMITSGPRDAPPTGVAWVKARGKSAADGSYRVVGLAPGRVQTIVMLAPGRPARTEGAWRARWTGAEVRDGAETRLDLVLGRGGVVAGRVLEAGTNAPVADAEVYLFASHSGGASEGVRTRVDERGAYRIEDVPFGRYAVMPTSPRHYFAPAIGRPDMTWDGSGAGADAPVVIVSAEGQVVERELLLTPGLAVRGVVTGPGGTPVAGAEIRAANGAPLYQAAWNWNVNVTLGNRPLATSDADGTFTVANLPPTNELTLYATKPPLVGAASARLKLEVGAPPPPAVTLTLAVGATVLGRVLDADGKPVAGRGVNWQSQDPKAPGGGNATTDDDGAFKAEGVPPTTVTFQTWGSTGRGGNVTVNTDPPLQPGEVREGIELRVTRPSWLRGIAVDATGAPVPRAAIVVQGAVGQNFTTGDDGTFDVAVPEGPYQLRGRAAPGGGPEGAVTTAKAPAENVRVVVTPVERTFTLVGGKVVAADGTPVPLCTVQVSGADGQAFRGDEVLGGEFRFEVDRKPPFTLVATGPKGARGEGLNFKSGKLVVEKEATDLVLTLEQGLTVRGRVLDPAGAPVDGVVVRAGNLSGRSDATGAFVVVGLASGEPLALQVQPPPKFLAPDGVTARPGGEEVVVRLQPSGFVAGRLVGLDEVAGVQGWVYVQSGSGRAASVSGDGTFRVEGLPSEGTVDLGVNTWSTTGGGVSPFAAASAKGVRIGTEDVVIVLVRGVHIRGVVVDADGAPVARVHLSAQPVEGGDGAGASTAPDGTFTLGAVRPGPYTVTVHNQSGSTATTVKVEAPAENVRIVLPRTRKVVGRVVAAEGRRMTVTVFRKEGAGRSQVGYGQTDGEGRFAIDVTGDGPFALNVAGPERYGRADAVEPGTEVEIQLVVGLEISGTVEPEARGATGTWVMAMAEGDGWQGGANCGPDGAFRVRGLPPGRYVLKVFGQGAGAKDPGPGTPVDAGATNVRLR